MILTALPLAAGHDIPGPLLTELTALYASNREFQALSGDFPDPHDIRPEQVAALAEQAATEGAEVLPARSGERLVGWPSPWPGTPTPPTRTRGSDC
ncbi:hypothetical protein QFZ56_003571 [Streptomyces achromogenes]|uniref:Uncharacterized protein n=1 Tax=Streptomyces achromogenes TaxID=67255 RepID=A0ABU0Q1R4_STRAH|nr:hypothetical protein [Streptomyces achromogenes]